MFGFCISHKIVTYRNAIVKDYFLKSGWIAEFFVKGMRQSVGREAADTMRVAVTKTEYPYDALLFTSR